MTARRIIASALAAATIVGGAALLAAPTAAAKPDNCNGKRVAVTAWTDQWIYSLNNYGANDARTIYAWQQVDAALDRQIAAGC